MKVLLVEDHQPTTQIVLRTLASCGHQAEICFSAEEAIDLLKERGVQAFDAFILDLKLPGMDGITLCRWIRIQPEGEAPYIIVGTGSDHSEELGNAFDAGADDYVEKPYQPKILGLRVAVAAEHIVARQERNRLNHELNREKDFIAAVFDTAAAFIVALNRDEEVVKINQACEELTEIKGSNFDGQHFCDLLLSKDVDPRPIRDQLRSLSESKESTCHFESLYTRPNGHQHYISWLCRIVESHSGEDEPLIVCVGTDITERRRMEAQLAFLAERDPLTNLYNRSQLDPSVQRAIDAARGGQQTCVMCVDLDGFKTVNDSAGHAAGDDLLQIVSASLARSVRPSDTVIRRGGDEFILVLFDSCIEQAKVVAERIRTAVDNLTFAANGRTFHVTASIGMVMLEPRMTIEEALGRADAACYASKAKGRNAITIGDTDRRRTDSSAHDTRWYDRLTEALAYDNIDLHLQPIVNIATGEADYYEALMRLNDNGDWRGPGEFMHSARRFDLLPEIDRCVVRRAIDMVKRDPALCLTVNLSGRSASDSRLPAFLINHFRHANLEPGCLIFEITESDLISDLPNAIERLSELRNYGFRFALDDFGQGYSSFNYLRKLPVEMVKIDGSFTKALASDRASAAFVKAIADLAHAIGIQCVAEYVECEDSLERLRGIGVDYAQGYHLGAPKSYPFDEADPDLRPRRYVAHGSVILPG